MRPHLIELLRGNGKRIRRQRLVSLYQPSLQLVFWNIQIEEFRLRTQLACTGSTGIPIACAPKPVLEDDADTQLEQSLRKLPLHGLYKLAFVRCPTIPDDPRHPLVRCEANGPVLQFQSPGQIGFA